MDNEILMDEVENSRTSAHLVEPAEETQAACCCLGRVQTGRASRVVVVDLRCLGDAVQQMVVRYGAAEGQILANRLEDISKKKQSLRARLPSVLAELKHVVLFHEKVVVLRLVKHSCT